MADLLSGFFGSITTPTKSWFQVADPSLTLAFVDADADAHISPSTPDTNFGSDPVLSLSGSSGTNVYMRFDLGAITVPIIRAKLSMRAPTNLVAPAAPLHMATDSSWSELSITWNNAPPHDSAPFQATGTVTRDGTISADVTEQVITDTDGVITIAARAAGGNGAYLSRDSGQPPRLILTLESEGSEPVPTKSEWGMIVMTLFILCAGTIVLSSLRRRSPWPGPSRRSLQNSRCALTPFQQPPGGV